MPGYIISKECVDKNETSIMGAFNTVEESLRAIFEHIDIAKNQSNVCYIRKVKSSQYIEVYEVTKGYIYGSSKTLRFVYQILRVPWIGSFKKKKNKIEKPN